MKLLKTTFLVSSSGIALYHYSISSFALVCIAKACEHSALTNVMKDPLLIVRVIFRWCPLKTLILGDLIR